MFSLVTNTHNNCVLSPRAALQKLLRRGLLHKDEKLHIMEKIGTNRSGELREL